MIDKSFANWNIGVLFSTTGVTAVAEIPQLNGTLLAIEEINKRGGAGGRLLAPICYDPGSQPKKYKELAEKLFQENGVSVIAGCYMSSSRKAVLPVVEKNNGLLMYPTLYEGFEYSDHCIYTGTAPNQGIIQLAAYLMSEFGKRIYLVGSNYVYPYETNRIITDIFHTGQGAVVAERYIELTGSDEQCASIVSDIKEKQPDVIISTIVGETTAKFYRAYKAAGLDSKTMPIASLTTMESEVLEIGSDVAEGHITAAPYFKSLPSAENNDFLRKYAKKFGEDAPVTSGAEAAYFQIHLLAQALEKCQTANFDTLIHELRKEEFIAPQGRVQIDPVNNHTYLWPRIARVNSSGDFDLLWESQNWVKPEPYIVSTITEEWEPALPIPA